MSGCRLDQLGAVGHVSVVLHDPLDDLVFLEVKGSCAQVVLDFVSQDRVSFPFGRTE